MPGLTDSQISGLKTMFGLVNDTVVRNLEVALAEEATRGGPFATVYDLVAGEAGQRRVRATVFSPVTVLCEPSAWTTVGFPSATPALLWRALTETESGLTAAAEAASLTPIDAVAGPDPIYDKLCVAAAQGLRAETRAFAPASELLNRAAKDGAGTFASYLDLCPLTRSAVLRLPEWIGRMDDERAAAARLAYKDAVALADDDGPKFFEMLFRHLAEPWQILRVISAIMDHPGDRYVAESELARFGDYVLGDIDRRLTAFRVFDASQGAEAGATAAEDLHVAAMEITEFETSMELSRDGPWGMRLSQQKKLLASSAETKLGQIEKALDGALPLRMVRLGNGLRGLPALAADPDPATIRRTDGLMAFFDCSRSSASQSGYGAARAKMAEYVEDRLDLYVEDLLEMLHAEQVDSVDRIHAYLEVCARFIGSARDEKAAQIVRRRAAAA